MGRETPTSKNSLSAACPAHITWMYSSGVADRPGMGEAFELDLGELIFFAALIPNSPTPEARAPEVLMGLGQREGVPL